LGQYLVRDTLAAATFKLTAPRFSRPPEFRAGSLKDYVHRVLSKSPTPLPVAEIATGEEQDALDRLRDRAVWRAVLRALRCALQVEP
jgi:hypothetical protein